LNKHAPGCGCCGGTCCADWPTTLFANVTINDGPGGSAVTNHVHMTKVSCAGGVFVWETTSPLVFIVPPAFYSSVCGGASGARIKAHFWSDADCVPHFEFIYITSDCDAEGTDCLFDFTGAGTLGQNVQGSTITSFTTSPVSAAFTLNSGWNLGASCPLLTPWITGTGTVTP
jgi:hypothetical protein